MELTTKEKMQQAREKRLLQLGKSLEKKNTLRNLEMALGVKIREKTGFLPLGSVVERNLLKRLSLQYSPSFILEMMDVALQKPEVYLCNEGGREDISFLSFYKNSNTIAQQCQKVSQDRDKQILHITSYSGEEKKELSPFYKGVLEKLKKKVRNIEFNST